MDKIDGVSEGSHRERRRISHYTMKKLFLVSVVLAATFGGFRGLIAAELPPGVTFASGFVRVEDAARVLTEGTPESLAALRLGRATAEPCVFIFILRSTRFDMLLGNASIKLIPNSSKAFEYSLGGFWNEKPLIFVSGVYRNLGQAVIEQGLHAVTFHNINTK